VCNVWSFILDYENAENPYEKVRSQIALWKNLAVTDIGFSNEVAATAAELMTPYWCRKSPCECFN
jgi:hypothetical protein